MMSSMFIMMLTMSSLFMMMNHPLSMGMILLIQTITTALITSNMNQNSWFSYIMFLILVGGMMVLFMYMTSIASNEKFKPFNPYMMTLIIIPTIVVMMTNPMIPKTEETHSMNIFINNNITMNKFINFPMNLILIFTILYLLMTLIASVKISEFKKGPLRQMN